MLILVFFALSSVLFAISDYRVGHHVTENGGLAYNSYSFIELETVTGSPDNESSGYLDTRLNSRVTVSKRIYKNGMVLLNFIQPFESDYYDFRVIINGGSSSDPLSLPGIRHFVLFLFSRQVERCMKRIFTDVASVHSKIKVSTNISTLYFTFLTKDTRSFFRCFLNAIEHREYLEKGSYFIETLQGSEEFQLLLLNPESTEVDKLAIRDIYSSVPVHGGPSLRISDMFSEYCYSSSINFDKILPTISYRLIGEIFTPRNMSLIFIGRLETAKISKLLSRLVKKKTKSEAKTNKPQDPAGIEKANKAIRGLESSIIVRKGFTSNVMRVYVPFVADDLKSLASNAHVFVMAILSSKHRNGILNFLFMNEFITKSRVNYYLEYSTIMIYIEVVLSSNGREHVPIIIDSIISYFNLMRRTVMSDRVFSEVQRIFDEQLSMSTTAFAESAEHYISSHLLMSESPTSILVSSMNTQFSRGDVEHFLSKMSLESTIVSLSVPERYNLSSIIFNKRNSNGTFGVNAIESHSNVKFTVFKTSHVFSKNLSSLGPSHAEEVFGLQLPNTELISSVFLPRFTSQPIFEKIVPLHNSLDIHNEYLESTNNRVTISHTMAFKSITTSRVWFSNNEKYGKSVKLLLKFTMREWSPSIREFADRATAFSILTALHILTAVINIKVDEKLSFTHRLGMHVEFVPAQSYYDAISDPFEMYMIVKSPTDYVSLVMSEVSKVLTSFDATLLGKDTLFLARKFAKDTLLRLYTGYNHFDKDVKVIAQIVSSQHCSFIRLAKALERGVNARFIQAVYSSLLLSPSIYGLIEGNLTPFHANHILNVFIESLDHKFFLKEINCENTQSLFNPVKYLAEGESSDPSNGFPNIEMDTRVLDVSTVPRMYRRLFTQKLDFTASSSCSTISILVGKMSVENYSKAILMKEALLYEFTNSASLVKDVSFTSKLSFIANKFIVILLSIESSELSTGAIARMLHENFVQSISRIIIGSESRSYIRKALEHTDFKTPLSDQRFLLSKFEQLDLMSRCRQYMHDLKRSCVSKLLAQIKDLPRIFIATQKVSNVKASISSLEYVPEGYLDIGVNYKILLDDAAVGFES